MRAIREVARSPALYLSVLAEVVAAAVLVQREWGRHPLDRLLGRLRCGVGRGGEPRRVDRARAQARVTGRIVRVLPPWGMGPCLKRSLILLRLWSREGFGVRIHLGFRPGDGAAPQGHAWLSADDPELTSVSGGPNGHTEVLVL